MTDSYGKTYTTDHVLRNSAHEQSAVRLDHLNLWIHNGNRRTQILNDINLDIHRGERWGIAGESGAGKTMTVFSMTALLPPGNTEIQGSIRFAGDLSGTNLLDIPYRNRHRYCASMVSVILQDSINALNPFERIDRQWIPTVKLYHPDMDASRVYPHLLQQLERFGISGGAEILKKYPHQLSGGMKQRIAIAMALESNADILIADEPTTSLDAINQRKVITFIDEVCKKNHLTLIYISHNLGIIQYLCDHTAVLRNGRIVEQGDSQSLFSSPKNSYTRKLIRETALLYQRGSYSQIHKDVAEQPGETLVEKKSGKSESLTEKSNANSEYLTDWKGAASGVQPEIRNDNTQSRPETHKNPATEIRSLLEVSHVTKTFRRMNQKTAKADFAAVKDVSFSLMENEILGLIGESGCGKSTLARMILGLLTPDNGTVTYNGKLISTLSERKFRPLRKEIQMIFQNPFGSLDPRIRAERLLIEPLNIWNIGNSQAERKNMIREICEECNLPPDVLGKYPGELSGGQLQRIAIARALLVKPKLLIADEIVSALDVSVQNEILRLLAEMKKKHGLTMLFITHDLAVVRKISDRVIVMHEGKLLQTGTPTDIMQRPEHAYVRELMQAFFPLQLL